MAAEINTKAVSVENLATFKTEMEAVVDKKITAAGGNVTYATEADIKALFAEPTGGETA